MFLIKRLFVDSAESFVFFPFTGKGFLCIHNQIAHNDISLNTNYLGWTSANPQEMCLFEKSFCLDQA